MKAFNSKTPKWYLLIISFGLLFLFSNCKSPSEFNDVDVPLDQLVNDLTSQVKYGMQIHMKGDSVRIPRSSDGNTIAYAESVYDWTSGFYPGILWQMFELSEATEFRDAAINYTWILKPLENVSFTHDLGFMINNSFGKAYEITNEEKYLEVLIKGANNLASRYDPDVGCIKSWNGWGSKDWPFPVIIDNMMNLELLFRVSELTGNKIFQDIAVSHAFTTMENHFRSDYSSYHVVDYDSKNGEVRSKETQQGLYNKSDWARGQAWGLYGFTMCYRFTADKAFLDHAEKIASFLLEHPNMDNDLIPFWDLKDPAIPNIYKDASAAAIMASAFAELYKYTKNDLYRQSALQIVKKLSQNEYLSNQGANHGFLLKHSVGSLPQNIEVDVSIVYADYYFLEALQKLSHLD